MSKELRELANQLEAAFRAAVESDQAKQLQRDLANGLKELSSQVKYAVKNAQENPQVQQATERGREAIHNARQSKTAHDLQETLVNGISYINEQLRWVVERIEAHEKTAQATPSQSVPVEHEVPVTGKTTKLDEDDSPSI
ncbi:hypothetical protein F8S13_04410 [Chloroflexia bacterium SDU3-3]|nr:hypothetical protein F8S13_04410 [Chloroflexia bacterium SDU3-3]